MPPAQAHLPGKRPDPVGQGPCWPRHGEVPMSAHRSLLATITAAAGFLVATPAVAFHCPQEMARIDKALASNPKLSEADRAKVKQLRAKGEQEHKDGDHQAALDTLAQAEKILGTR